MSDLYRNAFCCGIEELADIYEDKSAEVSIGTLEDPRGIVIFSDIHTRRYRYGTRLAAYIKKKGLGMVVTSPPVRNSNTGRCVKAWMWTVNKRKLNRVRAELYASGKVKRPWWYEG